MGKRESTSSGVDDHSGPIAPEKGDTGISWMRYVRLAIIVLGATGILALSARIQIPFYPVPMTLQTLAVLAIGAMFGFRIGILATGLYLAEGFVGLPVFAGGSGPLYMAGPTGGYLAGFMVAAVMLGWASDRGFGKHLMLALAFPIVAATMIIAIGFAWLATLIGVEAAWAAGVAPFLFGELTKSLIVGLAWFATARFIRR